MARPAKYRATAKKAGSSRTPSVARPSPPRQAIDAARASIKPNARTAAVKRVSRKGDRQLRRILQLNLDAIYVHVDNIVVYVNSAAVRLFRARTPDDLIGREASSLIDGSDLSRLAAARQQINDRSRTDGLIDLRMRRLDGSIVETETFGVEIEWNGRRATLATIRDVSSRKRAELLLRESEAQFRSVFESAPNAIFVHVDERIVFVNEAAVSLASD